MKAGGLSVPWRPLCIGDAYPPTNRCPHRGGDLSLGKLEGTILTCSVHHSQFDLTDGRVIRWTDGTGIKLSLARMVKSPRPLKTYEMRVEGNKLLISDKKVLTST